MRIDLKKFLFVGLEKDRSVFFEKAQEIGVIHFIAPDNMRKVALPQELQKIISAIKIVRSLPVMEQEELDTYAALDDLVDAILHMHAKLEELQDQAEHLADEIEQVSPLGNYDSSELQWIANEGHRSIQFFCAREGLKDKENLPAELIYVNTSDGLDYFISIAPEAMQFEKMVEIKPEASLQELKAQKKNTDKEIHALEHALKDKAKYNQFLHHGLVHRSNRDVLLHTTAYAEASLDDLIFAVEGWVPVDRLEPLHKLAEQLDMHIEEVAIEPTDVIPTCLQNEGYARIGEDLVHIYDTPSATDKDPSVWVLVFFALFFSIIIGDAGYGLILLLAGMYFQYKQKKITYAGKRFFKLLYVLSGSIMVWGLLNTSFFGMVIPMDSPIRKLSLMTWLVEKKTAYHFALKDEVATEWMQEFPGIENLSDANAILNRAMTTNSETCRVCYDIYEAFANNITMELALLIGVIHITLSLLRYANRHISSLGWIAVLIGGYLFVPSYLNVTAMPHFILGLDPQVAGHEGLLLIYGGLIFALIASFFEHGWLGPIETLNRMIQLFSDSMSYLRLYALGLSGSLVTATMNDLASNMNVVFAALLLITGHLVNLVLGIMGGVIHGLRLNFLEWYHYSFEGDGKRFNPLNKIEIE
jgi:V/A-type H+-transporting ATPase subunit I